MSTKTNIFVRCALALLIVLALVLIITLVFKLNSLKSERDTLQTEVIGEKLKLEELKEELGMDFDEDYIKKIAREQLGYRMPDEIIYYNDLNK